MGLAQRRIVEEYKGTAFEKWKKDFDKVCGFAVDMDVKWETMQSEDYQNRDDYFNWYQMVYFKPLMEAFQSICQDQMGKKALKEKLKKIVIDGTTGSQYANSKFDNGVFTINHKFSTNVDSMDDRSKGWREMIEAKL